MSNKFNNPVWQKKEKTFEHASSVADKDIVATIFNNNVPCTLYSVPSNLIDIQNAANNNSVVVQTDNNGDIIPSIKSNEPTGKKSISPDPDNPVIKCLINPINAKMSPADPATGIANVTGVQITSQDIPIPESIELGPALIQNQSYIIMNNEYSSYDTNLKFSNIGVDYTLIPSPDGSVPLTEDDISYDDPKITGTLKCNLVNTGTETNPKIMCQQQLNSSIKNVLPAIVPAGCILQNTGTQSNPMLSCSQILSLEEESVSTKFGLNISNTENNGVLAGGSLTATVSASNPYKTQIDTLNKVANWACPAGYIAQYPNQSLIISNDKKTQDMYLNPADFKQPCIGPANSNFKIPMGDMLNNGLLPGTGVLDHTSDIQCQYGYPIFSGIVSKKDDDTIFQGNVYCLYDKGAGQIF